MRRGIIPFLLIGKREKEMCLSTYVGLIRLVYYAILDQEM
jgi:hypothetical protein